MQWYFITKVWIWCPNFHYWIFHSRLFFCKKFAKLGSRTFGHNCPLLSQNKFYLEHKDDWEFSQKTFSLFFYLSFISSMFLSLYQSLCPVFESVFTSLYLYVCLYVCLFVFLKYVFIPLFICLSFGSFLSVLKYFYYGLFRFIFLPFFWYRFCFLLCFCLSACLFLLLCLFHVVVSVFFSFCLFASFPKNFFNKVPFRTCT